MVKDNTSKNHAKPPLKWNEENLTRNAEIQKAIIVNMKEKNQFIDEPKTPYRYASSDEEEDSFQKMRYQQELVDTLNQELGPSEENRNLVYEEREWGESSDEDQEDPEIRKRKEEEFKKKKQLHYNEFQMLQKFRQQQKELSDEDDDDEIKQLIANPPKIVIRSKSP